MKRVFVLIYLLFAVLASRAAESDTIRIVSYNVGAFSKNSAPDYQTIARMMREVGASSICLNELDRVTGRSEGVDQLRAFTVLMGEGWSYRFGSAMPFWGGDYGSGISTCEEILGGFSTRLPKCDGSETRVLVVVETPRYILATTHLDHTSLEARLAQIDAINTFIENNYAQSEKPIFLGGDLNDTPESRTLREIEKQWRVISVTEGGTYPADKPSEMIDYILQYRGGVECEVLSAKVLVDFTSGDVVHTSDHLPIMVDILIKGTYKN